MVMGGVDVEPFCMALAVRVVLFVDWERERRLCEIQRRPINLPTNIRN